MVEVIMGGGLGLLGIIQTATYMQSKKTNDRLDKMVSSDTCEERRSACSMDKQKENKATCRKINIVENKLYHHKHEDDKVLFYQG